MSLSRSGLLGGDHIAESRNLYADAADCFDLGACGQTVVAGREPGRLDDEVEIAESGGKVQHVTVDRDSGLVLNGRGSTSSLTRTRASRSSSAAIRFVRCRLACAA